jgi:hypothetical protein
VSTFWTDNQVISVVGSRNFTNSPNHEAAFVITSQPEAIQVRDYALSLESMSTPVTLDDLMLFVIKQTGSDYALNIACGTG